MCRCLLLGAGDHARPEPRMCSVNFRPGVDTIGIALQPDKDFGHIIKKVEPNSPAARAGIEQDDCILSLNETPLLNIPYDEVLNVLKKSRNSSNLDFLVAKKAHLLKSGQPKSQFIDPSSAPAGEMMPSSNINGKNLSATSPATATLEQLYNKYTHEPNPLSNEQTNLNRPRETISTTTITTTTERYDSLSPQLDHSGHASKQQQGQILRGVGPATADQSSWGASSEKTAEVIPAPLRGDLSVRSNSAGRRAGQLIPWFRTLFIDVAKTVVRSEHGKYHPSNLSVLP